MASGVNVKMGVSGVAQFKQNMNQAKQSVKTLDAQLALTEKQFKASGDAESYMTEKAELLKAKLEQQKAVVANAEKALDDMTKNGVDRSSTAYQNLYRQMLAAKGEMLDTENAMQGVAEAGDEAADGVDSMNQQLQQIGKNVSADNVHSALTSITDGMKKAMSVAWELGKAITREVLGAGSWADDLSTRAKYYGLSTEELQRMEKTANLIDTSVESIIGAQKKLRKGLGSGDTGVMGAFAELFGDGYNPNTVGWEQAFWDAGEALMKFTDEEEKEVYAQKLFGKSWNELIPLFEAGKQKYDELKESWSVVPQENIDNLTEMDDQYQILQADLDNVKKLFLSELAPAVTSVMQTLTGLVGKFNEYLQTEDGKEMMESLSQAVTNLFTDLTEIDPDQVMNTVTGILDTVKKTLEWFADPKNREGVVNCVKGFIGAWAGLEVAKGVTTALRLINGIKGLTTGAGVAEGAAAAGKAAGTSFGASFVNAFISVAPAVAQMLGITAVAIAPAMAAQAADEKRWAEQKQRRIDAASRMTGGDAEFMLNAAEALDQVHAPTSDSAEMLMGLRNRGTIEKARLFSALNGQYSGGNYATDELLRFWESGGEGWDQARTDALMTTVTDSYTKYTESANKMEQATTDLAGSSEKQAKFAESATEAVKAAPGEIFDAVVKGMQSVSFSINIDGQSFGAAIEPHVSAAGGGRVWMVAK